MHPFELMMQKMQADAGNATNAGYQVPAPGMGGNGDFGQLALNKRLPPELMNAAVPAVKQKIQQYQQNLNGPAMTRPASAGSVGSATRTPSEEGGAPPTGNMLGEGVDTQELMRAIAEQDEGIKAQQALADKFRTQKPQTDYSPLLGMIDAFTGSKLSNSYTKPMTADERAAQQAKYDDAVNSQRQKKTGDLVNLQKSKNSADTSFTRGLMSMLAATNAANSKDAGAGDKRLDTLEKEYIAETDPTKGRAGEYGKMYNYRTRADRAAGILANRPSGNLTNYQKSELAGAVASLVTNGNQTAVETIRRFDPASASMSYDQLVQWLTNSPQVLQSGEFVETFRDLLQRERDIADENLENMYQAKAARFYVLKAKRPDVYATLEERVKKLLKSPTKATLPTKEEMKAAQEKEAAQASAEPKGKKQFNPQTNQTRWVDKDGNVLKVIDGKQ